MNGNRWKMNISQGLELENIREQLQTKIVRQSIVDRRETYRKSQTIG